MPTQYIMPTQYNNAHIIQPSWFQAPPKDVIIVLGYVLEDRGIGVRLWSGKRIIFFTAFGPTLVPT